MAEKAFLFDPLSGGGEGLGERWRRAATPPPTPPRLRRGEKIQLALGIHHNNA
jgi:hypothetical protein